jgi:hypothetical protein
MGKILAVIGSPANTLIHDEVIVGLVDEKADHFGGHNDVFGFINLGINENTILGEIEKGITGLIPVKEPFFHGSAQHGDLGQFCA